MVVGRGMLANAFGEYVDSDDVVVFASGVSNSSETKDAEFERERALLARTLQENRDRLLVYFSTCSVYDKYFPVSRYTKHKVEMEEIISSKEGSYLIARLPQVVGNLGNQKTLVNFLFNSIQNGTKFKLYDIERNLIDVDDVFSIVNQAIKQNLTVNSSINIANPVNVKVTDLVRLIENTLDKNAIFDIENIEGSLKIDTSEMQKLVNAGKIFTDSYIWQTLVKYLPSKHNFDAKESKKI